MKKLCLLVFSLLDLYSLLLSIQLYSSRVFYGSYWPICGSYQVLLGVQPYEKWVLGVSLSKLSTLIFLVMVDSESASFLIHTDTSTHAGQESTHIEKDDLLCIAPIIFVGFEVCRLISLNFATEWNVFNFLLFLFCIEPEVSFWLSWLIAADSSIVNIFQPAAIRT